VLPSAKRSTKAPASSSASKRPTSSRSARRTRTRSPTPLARASQSARMVKKPSPPFHCAMRPSILIDNALNSMAGRTAPPAGGGGEIGRGKVGVRRVTRAIDAYADGDRVHVALPFDQDAGEFGTREQKIVRPLDRQPRLEIGGDLHHGIVDPKRCDERKLWPMLGCRRPREQQAGVEIAGRRHPRAPAPAPARRL